MDFRNEKAKKLKQGAIRAMFDRAATMTDVISMGIGEPDMPTPELVCRAGAEALQQGLTHYTPNAGTMQLRRQLRRGVQRPAESGPEFLPSAAGEKLPEQIRVRRFGGNAPLQILRSSRLAVARGGYDGRDRAAGGVRKP